MQIIRRLMALCLFACTLAAFSTGVRAAPVQFQASGLAALGPSALLALDFIDGDGPSNQITTFGYASDGTLALQSLTGGASGSPGSVLALQDTSFFNEALLLLGQANTLSFRFDASAHAPAAVGFADAFSAFLLDAVTGLSLIETDDPTGANALLLFVIDGSGAGLLQVYGQVAGPAIAWQAEPVDANAVPEPSPAALVLLALVALALACRPAARRAALAAALALGAGIAAAADLGASVQITRSGFVLNRTSNTYDTQVTVRNTSADALLGPLRLVLDSATPANVTLYNSYGKTATGADYLVLPLPTGTLAPGGSTTGIVKLINIGQAVAQVAFGVQGERLAAAQAVTLNVSAAYAAGPNGDQAGAAVGAGWTVRVDGVVRGVTDATGKLTLQAPATATLVGVEQAPSSAGSVVLPPLSPGQPRNVQVLVDDGKEIAGEGLLRFDQVQQLLLPRHATRVSLRFLKDEQPIRLGSLNWVSLADVTGNQFNLSSLFAVQADGIVSATPAAFFQALAGKAGRLALNVNGNDAGGQVFDGTAVFHIADYRVRIQLQAPPSQPALALAGVRLTGQVLNTDIRFSAQSDASGYVVLPDLPAGNLSLNASTSAGGIVYGGVGTAAINANALIRLTLRGPQDVLNNVPPIAVGPLPPGALSQPGLNGLAAPGSAERPIFSVAEQQTRAELAARSRPLPPPRKAAAADPVPQVSVSANAAALNQIVQSTAQLSVKKGLKKATLKYTVYTAEYPHYVLQQSIYNDVWSVSVLGGDGSTLFDITRQINSQLSQEPVWQSNGSTGEIKQDIDVSALTAAADATLILRATAVNIGDEQLPTMASATLEASEPLIIDKITPSAMPANTANDGSYYSIPRSGATNTLARSFTLDVTKPSGATLTGVSLELRDANGAALMTVVQEAAPGSADIAVLSETDTSVQLRVRGTIANPASTIAGTPPPTRDLTYHFVVKGKDSQGGDIRDEKDASGKRSLWRMPDGLGRYGARDAGGDDWAARGTYNWLATNTALLSEINDVSGEHGRNLSHQTHARGTDIDMFHFYRFPGVTTAPGGGAANHTALRDGIVLAFQTVGVQNPPAAATAALNRVTAWLQATRNGLTAIAARPEVSQVIHCRGQAAGGMAGGWCDTLLRTGAVTRTVTLPNTAPQTQTLNVAGAYANAKMLNNDVHNDHIHITLNPGQIGE
ncbi:MAG: hypothetical protein QM788_00895 [Roseateles sp.]|uniref:hypothetical protein n=1 Tax=Roseateles sp. TaxID=1971397 RepID=UPI0039EC3F39